MRKLIVFQLLFAPTVIIDINSAHDDHSAATMNKAFYAGRLPIRPSTTLPAVHSSSVWTARILTATVGPPAPRGPSSTWPRCRGDRLAVRCRRNWPDADHAWCLRECAVAGIIRHPSGRHIIICARDNLHRSKKLQSLLPRTRYLAFNVRTSPII